MKKYFLAIVVLFSPLSSFADNKVSWVQDMIGGHRIQLENINGNTRITDVDSRESIVIKGEFAGKITNNQYTIMMAEKRRKYSNLSVKSLEKNSSGNSSGSGTYQVTGGSGGFNTPKVYFSKNSNIYLNISSKSTISKDQLFVTLYRSVPFWFDESWGTTVLNIDNKERTYSGSAWGGIKSGYKYYLNISKKYTGGYATGSYKFYQK